MQTGILLTTPGKNRFWHACPDAKTGLIEMGQIHAGDNRYGKAWGHADTVIEFGSVDPATNDFRKIEHISGPQEAAPVTDHHVPPDPQAMA